MRRKLDLVVMSAVIVLLLLAFAWLFWMAMESGGVWGRSHAWPMVIEERP